MIEKTAKVLIVGILLLLPFGGLLRVKLAENLHVLPQDILVFLFFIIVVGKFVTKKIKPAEKEFVLFSLFFVSIGVISLLINVFFNPSYNLLISILYPLRYLMYLSIFFYPSLFKDKKMVNNLLFFSGSAVVIIGFFQYYYYNNLGNLSYLGWDDHLYRLFSTFLDPNFVGIFYVIFLGFLLKRVESIKQIYSKKLEVFIGILTFFAIYLTYSRSAFISLFVLLVVTLIILKKNLKLIIPTVFLIVSVLLLFSDFQVEGLNPLRTVSSFARIESAKNALQIFQDHPLIGVGFNSYRYAQIEYGFRSIEGTIKSNADAGTDNSFLFVLATTGVIGFMVFIAGYYYLFKKLFYENQVYFSTMLAVFAGSLFINVLFYIPIITFIFFMLAFRDKD